MTVRDRTNFHDVGDFHEKFKLDNVSNRGAGPRPTNKQLMDFRIRFMQEELDEFCLGAQEGDHEKMFDALLDLAYVVLGSAQVLGYPWQEGWDEVQRANMTKERCALDHKFEAHSVDSDLCIHYGANHEPCGQPKHRHSLRGSINDVIKPPGWTPPDLKSILKRWNFDVGD